MTPKRTGASDGRPPSGVYVLSLGLLVAVAIGLTTWTVAGGAGSALELTGDEQPADQLEQSPADLAQSEWNGSTDETADERNGSDERDEDDDGDESEDEDGDDEDEEDEDDDDEDDEDDDEDERDDERGPPDDVGPPGDDERDEDDDERDDLWDTIESIFDDDGDNATEDGGG